MAHTSAKTGKQFTNHSAMRHDDARHESKSAPAPKAQPGEAESEMQGEEGRSPQEVVDAHGPAHEIAIKHPKGKGGKHTVSSKHPDGHQHDSEHDNAADAHAEASTLGGVPAAESAEGEPQAPQGAGIPGLS